MDQPSSRASLSVAAASTCCKRRREPPSPDVRWPAVGPPSAPDPPGLAPGAGYPALVVPLKRCSGIVRLQHRAIRGGVTHLVPWARGCERGWFSAEVGVYSAGAGQPRPVTAAKFALKSLARRYLELHDEIADLEVHMHAMVDELAPELIARTGGRLRLRRPAADHRRRQPSAAGRRSQLRDAVRGRATTGCLGDDHPGTTQPG